ncbi:hypothetical protein OROMI_014488 [Orobanche minor]
MPSAKNPGGVSKKTSIAEDESSKKRKRSLSDSKSLLIEKKKHKKASKSKARGTVTNTVIIKDVPAVGIQYNPQRKTVGNFINIFIK